MQRAPRSLQLRWQGRLLAGGLEGGCCGRRSRLNCPCCQQSSCHKLLLLRCYACGGGGPWARAAGAAAAVLLPIADLNITVEIRGVGLAPLLLLLLIDGAEITALLLPLLLQQRLL
jgi:hypothetical protein